VAFLGLVFVAGSAAGVVIDRLWLLRPAGAALTVSPAAGVGSVPGLADGRGVAVNVARLDRQLRLTPEQRAAALPLITAWEERVRLVQQDVAAGARMRLESEVTRLSGELSPILTAEQQQLLPAALDRLLVRPASLRGAPFGGRGPGRGRPLGPGRAGRE
jgi:hypothetical protein